MAKDNLKQNEAKEEHYIRRKKQKRIKKIKSLILSALLLLSVTIVCYGSSMYLGIFYKNAISDALTDSEYFYSIPEKVVDKACEYGSEYGILREVFSGTNGYDEIITKGKAYNDGIAIVNAKLSKDTYEIDISDMKYEIIGNLEQYVEKTGTQISDEEKEELADEITEYYKESLVLPYMEQYVHVRSIINRILIVTVPFATILAFIFLILQFKIHRTKVGALKYIAYSASGAVITSLIIPTVMMFVDILDKFNVDDEYLYKAGNTLLNRAFSVCIIFGVGCLVVYVAILVYIFRKQSVSSK